MVWANCFNPALLQFTYSVSFKESEDDVDYDGPLTSAEIASLSIPQDLLLIFDNIGSGGLAVNNHFIKTALKENNIYVESLNTSMNGHHSATVHQFKEIA